MSCRLHLQCRDVMVNNREGNKICKIGPPRLARTRQPDAHTAWKSPLSPERGAAAASATCLGSLRAKQTSNGRCCPPPPPPPVGWPVGRQLGDAALLRAAYAQACICTYNMPIGSSGPKPSLTACCSIIWQRTSLHKPPKGPSPSAASCRGVGMGAAVPTPRGISQSTRAGLQQRQQ